MESKVRHFQELVVYPSFVVNNQHKVGGVCFITGNTKSFGSIQVLHNALYFSCFLAGYIKAAVSEGLFEESSFDSGYEYLKSFRSMLRGLEVKFRF